MNERPKPGDETRGESESDQTLCSVGHGVRLEENVSGVRQRRTRLLLVDDDSGSREVLRDYFAALGFEVHAVGSGAEAIASVQRKRPDVVLLDVVMPDMGGRKVLEHLRAMHSADDLPIIMTTALSSPEIVVASLELGANDYVTKPFDLAVVAARVATQLRAKQARYELRELRRALGRAQEHVAASVSTLPPSEWAQALMGAINAAIRPSHVGVWLFIHDQLSATGTGNTPLPNKGDLRRLRRQASLQAPHYSYFALPQAGGGLLGVLVVSNMNAASEAKIQALVSFAEHVARTLELELERRELARSVSRQQAASRAALQGGFAGMRSCPTCDRCHPPTQSQCGHDHTELLSPDPYLPYELAGRYQLVRRIGLGGMGVVFRARDQRLCRDVAVKVLRSELLHSEDVRRRFTAEATMSAGLDHPGIVSIHDFGETESGCPYIVMEWLAGRDLAALLREQGPGSPKQVSELLVRVAAALTHSHEIGLVHRDIKPANLFVSQESGHLRTSILDFGVAKFLDAHTALGTRPGSVVGTPLYMAPEQLLDGKADHRSDIYSLAAVGVEAVTGNPPRRQDGTTSLLRVDMADLRSSLDHLGELSQDLSAAFSSALSSHPADRPDCALTWATSVAQVLDQLESAQGWKL